MDRYDNEKDGKDRKRGQEEISSDTPILYLKLAHIVQSCVSESIRRAETDGDDDDMTGMDDDMMLEMEMMVVVMMMAMKIMMTKMS